MAEVFDTLCPHCGSKRAVFPEDPVELTCYSCESLLAIDRTVTGGTLRLLKPGIIPNRPATNTRQQPRASPWRAFAVGAAPGGVICLSVLLWISGIALSFSTALIPFVFGAGVLLITILAAVIQSIRHRRQGMLVASQKHGVLVVPGSELATASGALIGLLFLVVIAYQKYVVPADLVDMTVYPRQFVGKLVSVKGIVTDVTTDEAHGIAFCALKGHNVSVMTKSQGAPEKGQLLWSLGRGYLNGFGNITVEEYHRW